MLPPNHGHSLHLPPLSTLLSTVHVFTPNLFTLLPYFRPSTSYSPILPFTLITLHPYSSYSPLLFLLPPLRVCAQCSARRIQIQCGWFAWGLQWKPYSRQPPPHSPTITQPSSRYHTTPTSLSNTYTNRTYQSLIILDTCIPSRQLSRSFMPFNTPVSINPRLTPYHNTTTPYQHYHPLPALISPPCYMLQ